MQILLHSDPNTDGSQLMAEHLSTVVNGAMKRFGERITRVEGYLSDVNSQAKSGGEWVEKRVLRANRRIVENAPAPNQQILLINNAGSIKIVCCGVIYCPPQTVTG